MALSRGAISGLVLSNSPAYPSERIDISTGQARDSADAYDLVLASGGAVDLLSVGVNGLDTGVFSADTTYHVYLVRRAADGAAEALASVSATNPLLPEGYDGFRRLGAVMTDGSGNVRGFRQFGRHFQYTNPVNDIPSAPHGAIGLRTLSVPAGVKVRARVGIMTAGDSQGAVVAWDPDCGMPSLTFPFVAIHRPVGGQAIFGTTIDVTTNASRQIYTGDGGTNAFLDLYTHGWEDFRDEYL